MAHINIYATSQTSALTADGSSAGVVTIADTSQFYTGAHCYLNATAVDCLPVVVTNIISSTTLGVRVLPVKPTGGQSYGRTDISAYTLLASASITMPAQVLAGPDEYNLSFVSTWNGMV